MAVLAVVVFFFSAFSSVSATKGKSWPGVPPSVVHPQCLVTKANAGRWSDAGMRCFHPDGDSSLPWDPTFEEDPDGGWHWGKAIEFTQEQRGRFQNEVRARKSAFAYSTEDLVGYSGVMGDYEIKLKHDKPLWQKPRRYTPREMEVMNEKCESMLKAGILEPASKLNNKYAARVTLPAKKGSDGEWTEVRFFTDFRQLNEAQETKKWNLPLPESIFDEIGDATVLSTLDLHGAFWQCNVATVSRDYLSFWWGTELYRYA